MWCKKEFLTPENEPSTSTVVSWAGEVQWNGRQDGKENLFFVEISNCHEKARLHRTYEMTKADWINQIKKLRNHLDEYLNFLENSKEV
ncbi:MAG: hypothetical protein ACOC33_00550 [bacterium]